MKNQVTQTFNDGVLNIYSVENQATPGNMPNNKFTQKVEKLRYDERTVGMSRYWIAMQAQEQIDFLVRTPRIMSVNTSDIVTLIDGEQYKIKQIQYPKEIYPDCMDLSLERLEEHYELDES